MREMGEADAPRILRVAVPPTESTSKGIDPKREPVKMWDVFDKGEKAILGGLKGGWEIIFPSRQVVPEAPEAGAGAHVLLAR